MDINNKQRSLLRRKKETSIGGVAMNAAGSGIYSGYTLSDGDDFRFLSLAGGSSINGDYFCTRVYDQAGSNLRAPAAGLLTVMHDVDPNYTGWKDSNRGIKLPQVVPSHTVIRDTDGDSFLRINAVHQTAAEQTLLNTGVARQVERGAMYHSAAKSAFQPPCIVEFYARMPIGPNGLHGDLWLVSSPFSGAGFQNPGQQYNFEGSGNKHNANWISSGTGNTQLGQEVNASAGDNVAGSNGSNPIRDGNFHKLTYIVSLTDVKYYIDDVLVFTYAVTAPLAKAYWWIVSNHVYDSSFLGTSYSASQWLANTAGVPIDVKYVRVWRQTGAAHYKPLVKIPDVYRNKGSSFSIVLPDQMTLWGATGLTEQVMAIPAEDAEPCTSFYTDAMPAGVTYTSGTRTLAGTLLDGAGAMNFVVVATLPGATCTPARLRVFINPIYSGILGFSWNRNAAITPYDLYTKFDCGRMYSMRNPKGLAISGLPAGVSISGDTGLITGTPTAESYGNLVLSATDSAGATQAVTVPYVVTNTMTPPAVATGQGVAAPILTGAPSLLASWDFNDSTKVVLSGSDITSISPSDGTAYDLTSSTSKPTLELKGSFNTARFTAANSQYMRKPSLSLAAGTTMVAILDMASVAANQTIIDKSQTTTTSTSTNRESLCGFTTSGFAARKGSTLLWADASAGIAGFTTGLHLVQGVIPSGNSIPLIKQEGTVISSVALNPQTDGNAATNLILGARINSTTVFSTFLDANVYRVLIYQGVLNDLQLKQIAVWANAVYGTPLLN